MGKARGPVSPLIANFEGPEGAIETSLKIGDCRGGREGRKHTDRKWRFEIN